MKKQFSSMLVISIVIALVACSGGGGGKSEGGGTQSGVQLSGTIVGGGPAPKFSGPFLVSAPALTPNAVWAIPIAKMQGANVDPVNFMLREETPIGPGGIFTFNLKKTITMREIVAKVPAMDYTGFTLDSVFDVDWMLVEMSGNTPVSVIRLAADLTYDSMMSIPLSAFTPTSLDLGIVSGGTASLTVGAIASDVTMSSGSLAAIARADDILGTITDIIRNCDINNNKCYSARQSFAFKGLYSNISSTVTASYDLAGAYQGYQIYFDVNDYYGKGDFDGICPVSAGTPSVVYTLAPPAPISIQSVTYSPSSPLTTSGTNTGVRANINNGAYTECFKGALPLYFRKSNTTNDWNLQFITGDSASQLATAFPAGDWVLSRNSATIARFEFSLAKPVDGSNYPIVIVPGIRLSVNPLDGSISAVNVKWHRWTGSAYEEVTDAALLNSMMGGFELSMDDMDGAVNANPSDASRRSVQINNIDFATSSVNVSSPGDAKGPFYYNYQLEAKYNLDYIGISYQFGGQSFRFVWATYL